MSIRRKLATSCVVALFGTAIAACSVDGQVPTTVTPEEFFAARVNGHTELQDFHTHANDRDQLKVSMGQPLSESCETTEVETTCQIEWDGILVSYTDMGGSLGQDLGLFRLTLTGPAASLDYGGTTIRVGDPISQLQQIFPEAYQNRGDNCPAHPASVNPCRHAVVINDGNGVNGMQFQYNPSTLAIEEIRWHRNII